MKKKVQTVHERVGKRGRQVLDVLYRRGALTAGELIEEVPDFPSYSAARAALRNLEDKGLAEHRWDGSRYVYRPTVARSDARRSALRHLVDTFFGGSTVAAMQALVEIDDSGLPEEQLLEARRLIEEAEAAREDARGGTGGVKKVDR